MSKKKFFSLSLFRKFSFIFLSSLSYNDLKEIKINYALIISPPLEGLVFDLIGHKIS